MKKMFTEYLPRWNKESRYKGKFNWQKSIGYEVNFQYENIFGKIKILDYDIKKHILTIKYLDKEPFKIKTNDFQECKLGKLLDKYTNEFKIEIGTHYKDDKRNIIIIDRKYKKDKNGRKRKWYKYHCNKCRYEDWVIEHSLLTIKTGCLCCDNKITVSGINDIPTTAPWMVKFFQGGYDEARLYTKCSSKKIYFRCPMCGKIKNKPMNISRLHNRKSIGCGCGDGVSYPFKLTFNIFEQLNIKFIPEYSPDWVKPKRYDFYFELNNNKYIVEMDGGWHNKDNNLSGQTVEESKNIDDYKDKLANEHNIEVIRINCDKSELEFIKEKILDSELSELFNLSNIDWLKCEEFALSNLVKKACELKRDNPNMTSTQIGKIMKLSNVTIKVYLKKGTNLDWCNYNPKEEMQKSAAKNGKTTGKPVEIFQGNISKGIFKSVVELSQQSEKIFGIKLRKENISLVCNGKFKQHKGFVFRYLNI